MYSTQYYYYNIYISCQCTVHNITIITYILVVNVQYTILLL